MTRFIHFDNGLAIEGRLGADLRDYIKDRVPTTHRCFVVNCGTWLIFAPFDAQVRDAVIYGEPTYGSWLEPVTLPKGTWVLPAKHGQTPLDRQRGIAWQEVRTRYKVDGAWVMAGDPQRERAYDEAFAGNGRTHQRTGRAEGRGPTFGWEWIDDDAEQRRAEEQSRERERQRREEAERWKRRERERWRRQQQEEASWHRQQQATRPTAAPPSDYEVLFVTRNAPKEVIDAAYKALSKLYHPDRGGDPQRMVQLNVAYGRIKK